MRFSCPFLGSGPSTSIKENSVITVCHGMLNLVHDSS
jgi:hypothetical protein